MLQRLLTLLEPGLAWVGRRLGYRRGARYFEALRKRQASYYRGRAEAWAVISDYDGGLKLRVDRSAYIGGLLYWHGGQPTREFALLRRVLQPDMVMIDVGANQGEATLIAARRTPRGRVIAVEPMPALYAQLQQNVRLNGFGHVAVLNCALAAQPGQRPLYTSMDTEIHDGWNEGLASLFPSGYRDTLVHVAEVETLDRVVQRSGLQRVDVIKIDVEGGEAQVLDGALATLRAFEPALIMEVNPSALASAGSSVADLRTRLDGLGYQLYLIGPGGVARPAQAAELEQDCDVLCLTARHPVAGWTASAGALIGAASPSPC